MSQRVPNVNANFVNAEADPAQTIGRISPADGTATAPQGGIEGIVGGAIVMRVGVNGPSGIETMTPTMIITPSVTVT